MVPRKSDISVLTSSTKLSLVCLYLGILSSFLVTSEALTDDIEAAASEPKSVSVAEPNLGALLGIGNPLASGNPAAILQGLGANPLATPGGGVQNLQALRDSGALGTICNNGGNSDALANLLVYQYLSGSLPGGAGSSGNPANVAASARAVNGGNSQLQALLEGARESRTTTSITTTLTTRTITLEATTRFSTTTTSYTTTITSLTSSVLPIIFRGSKITTTITDRITEVLTATEFHTSSSVLIPSIIQTLNVEVTLTETSTKGLNGHFTLAHVTPGATKVIDQPISSSSAGFDTQGLDLSSLRGLGQSGDNAQVVNALTALLQQYNEEEENVDPRLRGRDRKKGQGRNVGNTRFHARSRFSPPEDDSPKFNVIRGFTLSDRQQSPRNAVSDNSGSAIENTRYSKFRKNSNVKNVKNNSLRPSEQDRESERFSASTSRRTVSSRTDNRRRDIHRRQRSRLQANSDVSGSSGVRTNRHTERSRRRSGRTLLSENTRQNVIRVSPPKNNVHFKTTHLTMHISGAKPGEIKTTVRVVTLRGFGTARIRRHIEAAKSLTKPIPPIPHTKVLNDFSTLGPKEVVALLQNVDRTIVKNMLYSLKDWVNYYLHQVLDEAIEPSFIVGNKFSEGNETPELYSSQLEDETSLLQGATVALVSPPNAITEESSIHHSTANICPKVSVVTETVYQTVYKPIPN